jgi:3-deoxy-D-manno-octulosonic-acid transferase
MTRALRDRLPEGAKILVAGSVLEGEEAMLLAAWRRVAEAVPDAVMVLAPRRKERFAPVAERAKASGFRAVRASELTGRENAIAAEDFVAPGMVIVLDTIGDLASVYSLAAAAFVGGSLVKAGGHNPLEPARFGVPVAMGGSYENFREIVEAMHGARAIRVVDADGLAVGLIALLMDDGGMGERGRGVFEAEAGATRRTVEALLDLITRSAA